jgi:hypothetical protein
MNEVTLLRRALAARGVTPASRVPEASRGRTDDVGIRVAELIEGPELAHVPVGEPEVWPGPVAFLDGTQHVELVGYAGASPIFAATIAASVRERRDRRLATAIAERRRVVAARPRALEAVAGALGAFEPVPIPDDEAPHPIRDGHAAAHAVDRVRGDLEVKVGNRYRAESDAWLVVDGSLAESPAWSADPRMVGVAKSHASLPFDGAALEHYLRLPPRHRSSIFAPASRALAPVRAWGLRLWPWEGKDLFHGLIRVEVAPANGTTEAADRISRWLLAERAPVSAPDPRWDRLLYGVRSVEAYLRAR